MQNEKEKQMDMEEVDSGEERMRNEQITQERDDENRDKNRNTNKDEEFVSLFENKDADQFRTQWLDIQSRFVDDPSVAVKDADDLVADVIKNITRSFADKRTALEGQWKSGDVSTEDLRVALKRYRSFFNRLLTLQS